jgi:hypothetical protein
MKFFRKLRRQFGESCCGGKRRQEMLQPLPLKAFQYPLAPRCSSSTCYVRPHGYSRRVYAPLARCPQSPLPPGASALRLRLRCSSSRFARALLGGDDVRRIQAAARLLVGFGFRDNASSQRGGGVGAAQQQERRAHAAGRQLVVVTHERAPSPRHRNLMF